MNDPTPPQTSPAPADPMVSIIVANWNGGPNLVRCLSSLQIAARFAGAPAELVVVDDASSDGGPELIRSRFPRVRLLSNARNIGFARTVNRGVRHARGRIVVLANNDILAREDFVANLVRHFRDPRLFAVSAKTVGWYDGRPNQLCMGAVWKGGRITPAWNDPAVVSPCLFAQAGAAAYDRAKFLRLGGLASFYEPGYWEDYDLSWRAAKRGWRQLYDPEAFALHVGGGSMTRRYGAEAVAVMKARNHLLFEAANLTSPRLLAEWAARLPLALARECLAADTQRLLGRGATGAMRRIGSAICQRLERRGAASDEELLARWRDFTPSF